MQRRIACRASEEVSGKHSVDDGAADETHLTSEQMPNSLQDNRWGR